MTTDLPPSSRTQVLTRAWQVLTSAPEWIDTIPAHELGQLLTLIDGIGAAAAGATVAVTASAVAQGQPAQAGQRTREWVRQHAPSLRQAGLGPVVSLADELSRHRVGLSTRVEPSPDTPAAQVWAQVSSGRVLPGLGVGVLHEIGQLLPRLVPEAVPTVTEALIDLGASDGLTAMRRLRPALLARYGQPGELEQIQEALVAYACLSQPQVESAQLTHYRLAVTPHQAAMLEAAIAGLSAPIPNPVTGERDTRPAGQRRVEALTDICAHSLGRGHTRSEGTAGPTHPGSTNTGDHTTGLPVSGGASVHVLINLTDLSLLTRERLAQAHTSHITDPPAPHPNHPHRAPQPPRREPQPPESGPPAHPHDPDTDSPGPHDPNTHGTGPRGSDIGPPGSDELLHDRLTDLVDLDDPGPASGGPDVDWTGVGARVPGAGGSGVVVGSWAQGAILSAESVRQLACCADLIPHVLGSRGELLDLGRTVRLYTPAQRRALTRRDRHCTYPGCHAPADWTRIHHVIHWLDGGATDLTNAALLCQHHHTLVHTRRLTADVSPTPDPDGRHVHWDLHPGSYDQRATAQGTTHDRCPDTTLPHAG